MEDTLGDPIDRIKERNGIVLILVLMEDTLGGNKILVKMSNGRVLILVLMEDTLGEFTKHSMVVEEHKS